MREQIVNEYVNWLFGLVYKNRSSRQISYTKLLTHLDSIPFRYIIAKDQGRAEHGIDLRYHFALERKPDVDPDIIMDILGGPCTVLEMMIALAIHAENIMDNPQLGDRTAQWFWDMVKSLGLGRMTDENYDSRVVESAINRFLDRDYEPDGRGGLFTIVNSGCDLRTVEIWWQLCWYLDSFT